LQHGIGPAEADEGGPRGLPLEGVGGGLGDRDGRRQPKGKLGFGEGQPPRAPAGRSPYGSC
jgi:hypothetical protein